MIVQVGGWNADTVAIDTGDSGVISQESLLKEGWLAHNDGRASLLMNIN